MHEHQLDGFDLLAPTQRIMTREHMWHLRIGSEDTPSHASDSEAVSDLESFEDPAELQLGQCRTWEASTCLTGFWSLPCWALPGLLVKVPFAALRNADLTVELTHH